VEFNNFGLDARLLQGVADLGFTRATPIQEQTIPAGLAGRDLLAAAMTGSGKTAAFLLPILHRLLAKPRGTTRVLVLTPTRELAAQILEHFELLAKHTNLTGAAVFGGVAMGPQERAFKSGVDILVATPGRLLDHLQNAYAKLGISKRSELAGAAPSLGEVSATLYSPPDCTSSGSACSYESVSTGTLQFSSLARSPIVAETPAAR
jgi:superfamily II DNA/RNA helicase